MKKQIKRTYYAQYVRSEDGLRLKRSRAGSGKWMDHNEALPNCLKDSIDVYIPKSDEQMLEIYEGIFRGAGCPLSGGGYSRPYEFHATGNEHLIIKLTGSLTPEDQAMDPVPKSLSDCAERHSTGRWGWDKAHLCVSGKDADLELGYQAAELVGIRGKTLHCKAHIGKTFVGDDVCLNLTSEQEKNRELSEKARERYLARAYDVVCSMPLSGDWSGDDWFCSDEIAFSVRLRSSDDETCLAVQRKLEKVLKPLEDEIRNASDFLNVVAGWRDKDGNRCPEGTPGSGSISKDMEEE